MPKPSVSLQRLEELAELFRSGYTATEAAAVYGVAPRTVYRWKLKLGDMCRPVDAQYHPRYLSRTDRYEIARLARDGVGVREIGRQLGRSASTISRELRRNAYPVTGAYLPEHAHDKAWQRQRRPKTPLIEQQPHLWRLVKYWLIKKRWSPQQISGRLRFFFGDDEDMQASHETIYQSIFVYARGEVAKDLKQALRSGRTHRRPRTASQRTGNGAKGKIPNLVSIHDRPEEVEGRLVPGHHEGDLIKGSLASNSAVGTLVERHSGYTTLLHLPDGWSSEHLAAAVSAEMTLMPKFFAKTLTWDRGTEMSRHEQITHKTGIQIYFADPRCPQQRPSNENLNGLLRQYLPKGEDLSTYSHADLKHIQNQLNSRPRKRLGYQTPNEVFANLLNKDQQT